MPLDQHISLEASIRTMHVGPGVGLAALHSSGEEDEVFRFMTYLFISHMYSLISSGRLYWKLLDGEDKLGT